MKRMTKNGRPATPGSASKPTIGATGTGEWLSMAVMIRCWISISRRSSPDCEG